MKKVMMLASVASMIDQFNMPNIRILRRQGYEVHVVANFEYGSTSSQERMLEFKKELEELNIRYYHVDFSRKITDFKRNIKAYIKVKQLILENGYEFIHCHSPIGGVCGRLVGKNTNTKVIYTAHGFHFFKGSPITSWILYYPVEKFLSKYTDLLITINKEDYNIAKSKFSARETKYIPGVGLDVSKFNSINIDKYEKKRELGIPEDSIVMFSVGELSKRKNHEVAIKALSKVKNKKLYYIICGQGELEEHLISVSNQLGIKDRVLLLGFRKDIAEICSISDIYVFPSQREGLGIAALEGMASGLPLISSYINGIKDYTENNKTGYCLEPWDVDGFSEAMDILADSSELRDKIGKHNLNVVKKFDINNIDYLMESIYKDVLKIAK